MQSSKAGTKYVIIILASMTVNQLHESRTPTLKYLEKRKST